MAVAGKHCGLPRLASEGEAASNFGVGDEVSDDSAVGNIDMVGENDNNSVAVGDIGPKEISGSSKDIDGAKDVVTSKDCAGIVGCAVMVDVGGRMNVFIGVGEGFGVAGIWRYTQV